MSRVTEIRLPGLSGTRDGIERDEQLALATFGVGYVARPVGALFLGHIGDKFGRKRVLVLTLVLTGASTFLVGCLPTYGHVGVLAPVLLVVLRLCQGFSASGEQAGANSMALEHAPSNRRAFFTSFTLSGTQAGLILATAVFLPIMAIGTQIGFALAGFAPTIAAALMKTGSGAWVPVAWLVAGACTLAALSTLTARETHNVEMDDLGRKDDSHVGAKAHI
jgi:MFS family permease